MHKSKIKEVPPESRTACKIDHFVCFCYCRPALTFYEKAIMKNYVKDEAIIITGGTSAFGPEAARMPLETGAMVTTTGRNEKRPAKARKDLTSDRLLSSGSAMLASAFADFVVREVNFPVLGEYLQPFFLNRNFIFRIIYNFYLRHSDSASTRGNGQKSWTESLLKG